MNEDDFSELKVCAGATEAGAVADIIKNSFEPKLVGLGTIAGRDVQALQAPTGMSLTSIKALQDEYMPQPPRRRGIVKVQDLDSFISVAQRFGDADSALFGFSQLKPLKASLTAVFNYNRKGGDVPTDQAGVGVARHGDHRAVYDFPFSDQWVAWLEKNGTLMKQRDFAEFIEDRISDVEMPPTTLANGTPSVRASGGDFGDRTPEEQLAYLANLLNGEFATPNRLVELSRGLAINEQSKVKNVVNLSSGEAQIQWETEHTDSQGQPIKIPNLFLITIPIFINSWVYRIAVRLRYRKDGGSLLWYYQLYRHDLAFQKAFEEHAWKARDDTSLPLYLGTPE